ncbi:MAG: glycoside-pentoside-hexuronide (GPH):cation symporter [Clostridiales bacterium]|nr:glycoside-pentoside-hexuronide (GPH):cation symporter [Clostridiales bacterium]
MNDLLRGAFIDSRKPTRHGRFRPYVFWFSIPLAAASVLMFIVIPDLSEAKYLLFAYITYIFYGMMYTAVTIPYGSLASVISDDEKERSSLSMWRSIGAGVGGLPGTVLLPMLVYTTTISADGTEIQTLDGTKLSICVFVLAVLSVAVYYVHFKLSHERIAPPAKQKSEYNVFKTTAALVKNRPFVMLCFVSMLLLAFQFYYQSTYTYLFADYYHKASLYSLVTVCTYLPMAILIPFMNKLITRFGKKELCAFGLAFAAAVNFALYFINTDNPYVFLVFIFFSGLGQTFLVLEIWALVMDVIDYHEIRTHRREEGTAYAFISFSRKLGQALAGVGLNALLALINYSSDAAANGEALPQSVLDSLYNISTVVPAVALAVMALILAFGYNLTKKKLQTFHARLAEIRQGAENL